MAVVQGELDELKAQVEGLAPYLLVSYFFEDLNAIETEFSEISLKEAERSKQRFHGKKYLPLTRKPHSNQQSRKIETVHPSKSKVIQFRFSTTLQSHSEDIFEYNL